MVVGWSVRNVEAWVDVDDVMVEELEAQVAGDVYEDIHGQGL